MHELIIYYLIAINLVSFFIMGLDKLFAIMHKYRVSEKTLFLLVVIGGSLGGIFAMLLFKHKTKHKSFLFGFSIIFILQIVIYILLLK